MSKAASMPPITEVYPDAEWGSYPFLEYEPLIKSMADDVLISLDWGDYQGDTFVLLRDDGRYGFLVFGWGSCPGCDALENCTQPDHVEELRAQLARDTRWFDDLAGVRVYIGEQECEPERSYWAGEFHEKARAEFSEELSALIDQEGTK